MIKKILKNAFIGFLVLLIGALIIRMILSSDKSTFDDFQITEDSKSTYAEKSALTVHTLGLKDKFSGAGYFSAYSLFYVEETGELQVTVRYNVSAMEYTHVDSDEDFEFVLLNKKTPQDLNPSSDEKADTDNIFERYDGVYMRPDSIEKKSKYSLYRFVKLTFKDVVLSDGGILTDELAIVMLPAGSEFPDADADALTKMSLFDSIFDSQTVHFANQPMEKYKLTKKDISALSGE